MASFVMLCIVILLLVLLEGFFSGSETAVTSLNRVSLAKRAADGDPQAMLVQRLTEKMELLLGTTLVGTNLAVVSSTTLATLVISRVVTPEWESLVNTLVMTPLILLIGEMVPKSIGRAHANELSLKASQPLQLAQWILYPLVVVVSGLAGSLAGLLGREVTHRSAYVTRDDLRAMAEIAQEEGLLDVPSGEMLRTVFELDQKAVGDIMVPLVDVQSISAGATVAELEALAVETGYTRFPVFRDRVDNVVGVVDLRSALYGMVGADSDEGDTVSLQSAIDAFVQEDVVYVPESKNVGALLHELMYHAVPMAVVVDEHGGVTGIITVEDLTEEVVGEIQDERDEEEQGLQLREDGVYQCDGRMPVEDLAEVLQVRLPHDGFATVAGLVLKLAGRIPQIGDHVRYEGFDLEVTGMEGRRIVTVQIRPEAENPEE